MTMGLNDEVEEVELLPGYYIIKFNIVRAPLTPQDVYPVSPTEDLPLPSYASRH
jgi:hypothetical protein